MARETQLGTRRELANVLERAVILAEEGKLITPQRVFLPRKEWEKEGEILPLKEAMRLMVARALARYGRTVEGKKKAARALGISLVTLYHYLHRMPGLLRRREQTGGNPHGYCRLSGELI